VIARGEYATLHRWLEQIPHRVLETRPALCLWAAWAALPGGEVERIEPLLQRAERAWLAQGDHRKLAEVAHLQAHLARLRHDAAATIAGAQHALANLAEEELTLRAGSVLALGAGQLLAGQLDAASTTLAQAATQCQAYNCYTGEAPHHATLCGTTPAQTTVAARCVSEGGSPTGMRPHPESGKCARAGRV